MFLQALFEDDDVLDFINCNIEFTRVNTNYENEVDFYFDFQVYDDDGVFARNKY